MKIRSDEIKRALSKRHNDEFFLTEVKTGPSTMTETLRFDALSIKKSWTKPCFTGYEVKVSRNDFLHDDKYTHYRDYCHRLYLVCPKDLIKPEEIPEDIGIMYYNADKNTLFTKRVARLREINLPVGLLYYILLSRLTNDVHPFFSTNREYIEAYIQDKAKKRDLAYTFKGKLIGEVKEAQEKVRDAEWEIENYKKKADERDKLARLLIKYGFIHDEWELTWNMDNIFSCKYPKELCEAAKEICSNIEKINSIIQIKETD